jgi:hypothetical protein
VQAKHKVCFNAKFNCVASNLKLIATINIKEQQGLSEDHQILEVAKSGINLLKDSFP